MCIHEQPTDDLVKSFLPDSQELAAPSFDFEGERRSMTRQRQRDDLDTREGQYSIYYDGKAPGIQRRAQDLTYTDD